MTAILIITLAHSDQVEPISAPDVPSDFLGPRTLPLCRGPAVIFTALLVLLAEDDSSDHEVLGEQQSQIYRWQVVGLSETAQPNHHQRLVFPNRLFGAYLLRLVRISHLIYALLDPIPR
jgi:hypothetical protein